jgi:hypothetical protein
LWGKGCRAAAFMPPEENPKLLKQFDDIKSEINSS